MNILNESRKARGWMARCSSTPDTTAMNTAATSQAALSKEELDWFKKIYADTAPDRRSANDRSNKISDASLAQMDQQMKQSGELYGNYKNTFMPLQKSIVADATNWDTPDRMTANANAAAADVEQGFSNVEGQQQRAMERQGVNPASGRAVSLANQTGIAKAAALAGAKTLSRQTTQATGNAMKVNAMNIGNGLPGNANASAGTGIAAGGLANSSGMTPVQVNASGAGIMQTGFGGAQQGLSSAGNLYGNVAGVQNQTAQANSAALGGLGSVAGAALMAFSDKDAKTDRKPIAGGDAVAAINAMPIESWKYKPGVADGGGHIGPMAQDVQAAAGDRVAPNGKAIDLISMNGLSLAAIQNLDKRLSKLEVS